MDVEITESERLYAIAELEVIAQTLDEVKVGLETDADISDETLGSNALHGKMGILKGLETVKAMIQRRATFLLSQVEASRRL